MGVTITAKNSTYHFDMGYGGFANLRVNIAISLDEDFGNNYHKLRFCHTEDEYHANDKVANRIIKEKNLAENNEDVLDFLYAPDVEGQISYKTCKKIYDLIKDRDFTNMGFVYAYQHESGTNDYEEFKKFLKECYSKKRSMVWR